MLEEMINRSIKARAARAGCEPGYLSFVEMGRKPARMNRYKRAFIKDREQRAKDIHAPKSEEDRMYQTQLTIFGAIMEANRESEVRGLVGQEQARFFDRKAAETTAKVAEIWKTEG